MKLFHASPAMVKHPDVNHSRNHLDFGRGFYLTSIFEQALRYAARFTMRGIPAYINEYELDDNITEFIVKHFPSYDEEWLDYVTACRRGQQLNTVYDAVSGGVANDKVFNTIDLYFVGLISKDEALGRLRFEKPNHQICILNQQMIERHLHFIQAQKIDHGSK